jgi:hypothetical protein
MKAVFAISLLLATVSAQATPGKLYGQCEYLPWHICFHPLATSELILGKVVVSSTMGR